MSLYFVDGDPLCSFVMDSVDGDHCCLPGYPYRSSTVPGFDSQIT